MVSLFGTQYDDEKLAMEAERALVEDPILNAIELAVSSQDGVVTLSGTAMSETNRNRAVETVRQALNSAGLEYDKIADELSVG